MIRTVMCLGVFALAVAGCAGSGAGDQPGVSTSVTTTTTTTTSSTRPMSTTVLPTLSRPAAPPSAPSDQLTGLWVAGVVTEGGDGPCRTVTADDGQLYPVSDTRGMLTAGERVKVRIVQPVTPVYCGAVEAFSVLEVRPAG